jgi:hypothetical protein
MSALLKWRQTWYTPGAISYMVWGEGWTEAWSLDAGDLVSTGHVAFTADLVYGITFDIGSGTMDMVGHEPPSVQGLSYPTEFVPSISGTLDAFGRTTIAGELDFDEPFFVDPPLDVYPTGHMATTGTLVMLLNKSIGSGSISNMSGHVAFATTSLSYQTAIVKQLFSLSLTTTGRSVVSGTVESTTVKAIGTGSMGMGGRSTIGQSGFQVEAPPPYTHPLGDAVMPLIGGVVATGDPTWQDWPAHDLGSADLVMAGHTSIAADRLFSGGLFVLPDLSLMMSGKTVIRSSFSYPGAIEPPSMEAVAVYEGLEMQEMLADLETEDTVVE